MGTLQIDVLGTSFAIQAKEKDEYLGTLLKYYKQMVRQVETSADLKDPVKVSILAGIMLCDELYKEKVKNQKNSVKPQYTDELQEAERIALKMIANIDKVLEE